MGNLVFDENSGWFKGKYIDSAGRRKFHRLSRNEKQAQKTLAALEGKAILDRHLGVKPLKTVRFGAFCEIFMSYARGNVKSWERYSSSVAKLLEFFGNEVDLVAIDSHQIEGYKSSRIESGKVEGATINRDLQVLKRMYYKAIDWDYARENPVTKVEFYAESYGRIRYLTREEFVKVLEAADPRVRPVIVFAVHTGMRQSEILGLQWSDMDLENRYASLYVTKNSEPRKVALNASAVLAVLPLKLSKSDYVFSDSSGVPLSPRTVLDWFKRALAKAGIRDFRFHDLRHTCASWMAMAGVPIEKIKAQLGHKDIRMTMRYMHLAPDGIRSGADQLDRWFKTQPEWPVPGPADATALEICKKTTNG
jgi:integrase